MAVKHPWLANDAVFELMDTVREKHHLPRLQLAKVAVCFQDAKPFVKGRFNWGKTMKFSPLNKLFHQHNKVYDFLIILSTDAWHEVLTGNEREALLDLHLTRCQVEYVPHFIEENGKKKPVKDKWGRIEYSNEMKFDEEGTPVWKVEPLDLPVYTANVKRYGIWCEALETLKEAVFNVENNYVVEPFKDTGFVPGLQGVIIPNADVSWSGNYADAEAEAILAG